MYSYWFLAFIILKLYLLYNWKNRPSAIEKNFPLQNLQHRLASRQADFYFIFVSWGAGGQVGFFLCQSHMPCSLISGMVLLSFVLGKLQKGREFQWEVTETTYSFGPIAYLSCIKEQFVVNESVWKEPSVAICENLLLQHLETGGLGAN